MAIVVESTATTNWVGVNDASSLTITKPIGLTVGELLVAVLSLNDEDDNGTDVTAPSGWSSIGTQKNPSTGQMATVRVFAKVATVTETGATDFSFTNASGEGMGMAGILYRISGHSGISDIQFDGGTRTGAVAPTYTLSAAVTPNRANSLLIVAICASDGTSTNENVTGVSIPTSNPTWTLAFNNNADLNAFFGTGEGRYPDTSNWYAIRAASTATGDLSYTRDNNITDEVGCIVVINEAVNVSTTLDTAGLLTLSQGGEPTFVLDHIITMDDFGALQLSGQDNPVTAQEYEEYTEQSKPSTSWTNQSK